VKALSQVESIEALRADDIADVVSYSVTPDRRVAVTEILVRTTEQSWLNVGSPHPRRCAAARFRRGHFLVGTLSFSAELEGDPLFKTEALSMRSPTDVTEHGLAGGRRCGWDPTSDRSQLLLGKKVRGWNRSEGSTAPRRLIRFAGQSMGRRGAENKNEHAVDSGAGLLLPVAPER